jgi:hypothetical protein
MDVNNTLMVPQRSIITDETPTERHPNFIEGPSSAISLEALCTTNIIPTFADNTMTLSHQNFIETVRKSAEVIFGKGSITPAEARVSHPIVGRIPSAQHKAIKDLKENEKTIFYQRLAWIAHVIDFNADINGQSVSLTIGGTRSYHEDKLYARPNPQHFRVFVGFRVRVCSNMMLTCDGVSESLLCMTEADLFQKSLELFSKFNPIKEQTLMQLESLNETRFSQETFCKIIGRLRLYQALPIAKQKQLPKVLLGDSVVNAAVKQYTTNPTFGMQTEDGSITAWQLMQLLNESVKSCYPDLWIDRNQNCTDFSIGIANAINGKDTDGYDWFLN